MARFPNIPDLDFAVKDPSLIVSNIVSSYQAAYFASTGINKTLAQGDPVRLFLLNVANEISLQRALIDAAGKQELLKYATGAFLDNFAAIYGGRALRIQASPASTTIQFTLANALSFAADIPAGTQVATQASQGLTFQTLTDLVIPAGQTTGSVAATCTTDGSIGNGLVANQINILINWNSNFVVGATNTSTSQGGADLESDDAYAARLYLVPDSLATTGTAGEYAFWAFTANDSIADVVVWSPAPGQVGVTALLQGNQIPSSAVLMQIQNVVGGSGIKVLTDLVSTIAPATVTYNKSLTYYIAPSNAAIVPTIQAQVTQAAANFDSFTSSQIGRAIDPGKLSQLLYDAGASRVTISTPSYTALSNGTNSLTATTANITVPAVNSTVASTGIPTAFLSVGQQINIGGTTFAITVIAGSTVTIRNLGQAGGAAASTVLASGSTVVSAPQVGVAGTTTLTYGGIDASL